MITYEETSGKGALRIRVRLGKKLVGGIYENPVFGFYYRPTGSSPGSNFRTIEEVKSSLEG